MVAQLLDIHNDIFISSQHKVNFLEHLINNPLMQSIEFNTTMRHYTRLVPKCINAGLSIEPSTDVSNPVFPIKVVISW